MINREHAILRHPIFRQTVADLRLDAQQVSNLLALVSALPPPVLRLNSIRSLALSLHTQPNPTQLAITLTASAVQSGVVLGQLEVERMNRLARREGVPPLGTPTDNNRHSSAPSPTPSQCSPHDDARGELTVRAGGERVTASAALARRRLLAPACDRFVVHAADLPLCGPATLALTDVVGEATRALAAETADDGDGAADRQAARGVRLDVSRTGLTSLTLPQASWQALGSLHWDAAPRGATRGSVLDAREPVEEQPFRTVQLRTLPRSIGLATNLRVLSLANQGLTTLPPEVGSLRRLRSLWLANNRLRWLPDTLGNLKELARLVLSENELRGLPTTLACCAPSQGGSLRHLTLDYNPQLAYPPPPLVAQRGKGLTDMLEWMLANPASSPSVHFTLPRRLEHSLTTAAQGITVALPDAGKTIPLALLWARARPEATTVSSPRTLAALSPVVRSLLRAVWDRSASRVSAVFVDCMSPEEVTTIVRYVTTGTVDEPSLAAIDLLSSFTGRQGPWLNADEVLLDRLHADMARLTSFSPDVYLAVHEGGEQLPAHRFLLAAQSSFFCALFDVNSPWSDCCADTSTDVVVVADTSVAALRAVLALAYAPDMRHSIDGEVIADAVLLADRLGMPSVLYDLESVLLTDCLAPQVALNLLLLARRTHLPRLSSVVDHYLRSHFDAVTDQDPTWRSLPADDVLTMQERYGRMQQV